MPCWPSEEEDWWSERISHVETVYSLKMVKLGLRWAIAQFKLRICVRFYTPLNSAVFMRHVPSRQVKRRLALH